MSFQLIGLVYYYRYKQRKIWQEEEERLLNGGGNHDDKAPQAATMNGQGQGQHDDDDQASDDTLEVSTLPSPPAATAARKKRVTFHAMLLPAVVCVLSVWMQADTLLGAGSPAAYYLDGSSSATAYMGRVLLNAGMGGGGGGCANDGQPPPPTGIVWVIAVVCGYLSAVLYVGSRLPQIYKNVRHEVEGRT